MIHKARRFVRDVLYGLTRLASRDSKATTDLLDRVYMSRVNWGSGLGQGGFLLYALVRCLEPDVVVEIGSARGHSTCTMALACQHNTRGKVYGIDPHEPTAWSDTGAGKGTEEFLRERLRMYGLEDRCEVVRATSAEAAKNWDRPIDLLFIDGDHTYEGVKTDFECFKPWLAGKALVVFHDSTWDYESWRQAKERDSRTQEIGVPQFLEELRQAGYHSVTLPKIPGLTILDPHVGGRDFVASWPVGQGTRV